MGTDYEALGRDIEGWARELGFQQVGIADTDLRDYAPAFRRWLRARLNGEMGYLARNVDKRSPRTGCIREPSA